FPRPFRIFIFGGGHVSKELAAIALGVDFQVTVMDDRPEFTDARRFSGAETALLPSLTEEDAARFLSGRNIGDRDGMVIVTRGHAFDRDTLAAALRTKAGYIGMIGSKSKRAAVYANLEQQGVARKRLEDVYSPIGLAIGADTPQEIAVSIAAELILWRSTKQKADAN
ncbi:XdhC family protein, partial [Desulfovibrio sp. OttesenSCG-928-A18]|nr:XdhC family protein [Desulfovibrio sp. OttesenSCG-928-A18]